MGTRIKPKKINEHLIKDLMEDFIYEKKTEGRAEPTLESYRNSFKKFFFCFDENITTEKVDKGMLQHFKNFMEKEETLHLASMNHYLRDLRTFFNWCYSEGFITEKLEIKMIKGQEATKETYTDEELEKLLAVPDRKAPFAEWRTWAIINWILGTGNRIETIVNVRIGDVHFGRDEIVIREQKNKTTNFMPLAAPLKKSLRTYINMWRSDAADEHFLFCNVEEKQLTVKALQSALYDYNKKRGVEKTSAHALRHTYAKIYIMNGGDVFRLQKMLGHKSLEMTRHYVNLFGADLKKGYDDIVPLNNFIKPSGRKKQTVRRNIEE